MLAEVAQTESSLTLPDCHVRLHSRSWTTPGRIHYACRAVLQPSLPPGVRELNVAWFDADHRAVRTEARLLIDSRRYTWLIDALRRVCYGDLVFARLRC